MARKHPVAHLEGAEALNNALRSVGHTAGGLTLRKAAEAGAKVIAKEAKATAPRDSGDLAENITTKVGRLQGGRAQFNVGPGRRQFYGRMLELGTSRMAAQPWLRPAFERSQAEAVAAVEQTLRDALKDVLS
jgi:HK97 gp10 family phage protein